MLTNIEFDAEKSLGVTSYNIYDADTGEFLAGGVGEPYRADLELTINA